MFTPARVPRLVQGALSLSKGAAVAAALLLPAAASGTPAQQPAAPVVPGAQQTPPLPAPPPPILVPGVPAAAPPPVARSFATPAGLLFNTIRPERVKDFELFLGHLRVALDKTTDPGIRAQARGWRMFKAAEPGPNNTVLYLFALDPAVAGADYSLGRILADAYPDVAQLNEIWKLYTSSVVGGGSLLSLTPLMPVVPPAVPPGAKPPAVAPAAPPAVPPVR